MKAVHSPTSLVASVIIVVKNDLGVRDTLAALMPQAKACRAEVVVVDASQPAVLQTVREEFPQVRWEFYNQGIKRFTIPEQRNLGLKLAAGNYLVFLDASCIPVNGWLAAIIDTLDSGESVVCGPVLDTNPKNLVRYMPGRETRSYIQECTTVSVGLRRTVVEAVKGFDERLAYGEDVDFFWRVSDAGFKLCSDPRVAVSHDWGETNEQFRRAFRYGKARAIIHKKHWRRRWKQLLITEPHVWVYPLYLLGLPIALIFPWYLLGLLIPMLKNRSFTLVAHHLVFAAGVLAGVVTPLEQR
ncbi:MAG TPA: glycosyltransferase [Candidatus Saccharimonadia bacterium]